MSLSFIQLSIKLDPGFWTKTSWIQLGYGVWVNMAHLGIGLAFGLPAVQVPQLAGPDSSIKITRDEASWIASVLTLFSPIGCLLSGYMIDRFGRRVMIIACQAPMFVGWMITGFAKNSREIIIGRAVTGIGCGMAMGPPRIFLSEISLPNMRGMLGAFPAVAISAGITTQAGLGTLLPWQNLCYICAAFTLLNFFIFNFLPETPYYVLMKDTSEHARQTLAKFRAKKYNLETEMKQILDFKEDNNIRKLNAWERFRALFTRSACKPFAIINTFVLITQASGVSSILMWAIEILTTAQSSFEVHAGNFLMAVTRLVMGVITAILLLHVGRKPLALISSLGVSAVCFGVGGFIIYNREPSLVPQICFMLYMAFATLGYYTVPFLMMAELYPLQIRGTLGGITVSICSILIFCSTLLYPFLRDNLGLANTMFLYGGFSLLGTVFFYFFLPETKDLTLQEIEEYYNALRPSLVSHRRLLSIQHHLNLSREQTISLLKIAQSKKQLKSVLGLNAGKQNTLNKSNSQQIPITISIVDVQGSVPILISKESLHSRLSDKSKQSGRSKDSSGGSKQSLKSKKAKKSKELTKSKESVRSTETTVSKESGEPPVKIKSDTNYDAVSIIRGSDDTLLSQFEPLREKEDEKPDTSKKKDG